MCVCVCVVRFGMTEVDAEMRKVFDGHIHTFHVSVVYASDDSCVVGECGDTYVMCPAL